MRNLAASTAVLTALLALPAIAPAQLLGPDGVKVGDNVRVGPGGAQVGNVQVPVPTVQAPPQVTETVRQVTEPVRQVVEPVRQVVEPVRQVAEPVRRVTETVRQVTEPVRQVTEPAPSSGSSGSSGSGGGGDPAGSADPPPGASSDGSPAAGAPAPRGGGGGTAPAGDAEGVSAPRRSSAVRRERQIRRTVARLSGCLDELPSGQRRVLVLRGGVDTAPRTRRAVARRLGVPVARVRKMELRGLRRARGLARAGACGEPAAAVTSGDDTAGSVLASIEEGGTAAGAAESSSQSQDRAAQGQLTSEQEQGATRGAFAERAPQTPPALIPAQVGIPLAIALALVALATILGFYTPALRTRLRRR